MFGWEGKNSLRHTKMFSIQNGEKIEGVFGRVV